MPVTSLERPEDLTAEWLTAAIGAGTVERFSSERIGTGQMSECYRVALSYADGTVGPGSVVLKVAASDPVSRQTGLALGLYEREVRFYTEVAPRIGGPVAPCYHAGFDAETGVFHLLLGDAAPAVVGDEIRGATIEQAMLAMAELGRLHGQLLGDAVAGRRGLAEPRIADEPGAYRAAVRRVRRALRREDRSGASRGMRAAGGQFRRVPRRAQRPGSRSGAR